MNSLIKNWKWIAFFSLLAKLLIATVGYNFDVESYKIVGDLVTEGKSVYANTKRYNYGPIWMMIIGFFTKIIQLIKGNSDHLTLHLMVSGLLAITDILLAKITRRVYSARASILFLLNPVSLFISGYHAQFDVLAVLLGVVSMLYLISSIENDNVPLKAGGWMGLSLMTKHLWIFILPWVFFSKHAGKWKQRIIYCALSATLFAAGFLPFIFHEPSRAGIVKNVFKYNFDEGYALFPYIMERIPFVEAFLQAFKNETGFSPYRLFMIIALLTLGFIWRSKPLKELFPLYLAALVAFSSIAGDQHLAIAVLPAVLFIRHWEMKAFFILTFFYYLIITHTNVAFYIGAAMKENEWMRTTFFPVVGKVINFKWAQVFLLILIIRKTFEKAPSSVLESS